MLTVTAHWPITKARPLLFVFHGVLVSLVLFGLVRASWIALHAVLPFTLAEGAFAVRLFGAPALPIDVTLACSGADAMALSLGAIAAYPASWRRRLGGAAGAIGLIIAINILRIGTLGRVAASRAWFDALHLYVWPAVLTLAITAYVLIWMRVSDRAPAVAGGGDAQTPPRLSRRFIALTAAFLLVFVSAAPFYLHSAAVIVVASFIARSAAAMLTAAGIHAHASANVLWAPHGGFLVTEECISTPLIPVYLAAVAAYAPNWQRRSLGMAAAAPIFIALGVARLLVVAVPASVASQTFFIHAFYQLLAGGAVVIAAAIWRHGDRRAVAAATIAIGAAAMFIALAGPGYSRLVAWPAGFPASDPQGAISFMPAFQTGLYLALWIAGGGDAGWKRMTAGLALLVILQIAGLAALNAVLAHSDLTIAVRDVRGWAVAAPALLFAAMVTLGRPRR